MINNKINKSKISAFTLAEVLITLLIIGVVSSIIIPALIQDSQEAEFHSAFKKTYSEINTITRRIALDNGGYVSGMFSNYLTMRNIYLPYLNYTKVCTNSTNEGCWASNCKLLNGGTAVMGDQPGVVLSNGISVIFTYLDSDCQSLTYSTTIPKCGVIEFDVNGTKPPNVYGKDIYGVFLINNNIKPRTGSGCIGGTGIGCSYDYLFK